MASETEETPTDEPATADGSVELNLDENPDGMLLRLGAIASSLRANAAELERIVAALPAVTVEGKVVKKIITYRQQNPCET